MSKIYVGNLSFNASEPQLENLFREFGNVRSVQIIMDRETGRSRGFAFVEMDSADSARKAISALDGKDFDGRSLRVNEARPQERRSDGGGGGGGGGGRRGGGGGGGGRW